jgi:hypothetical protein
LRLVVIYYAGEHPYCPSSLTSNQSILVKEITREVEKLRHKENQNDHHTNDPAYHKRERHK